VRVNTFIAAMKTLGIFGNGLVITEGGVLGMGPVGYFNDPNMVPAMDVYATYTMTNTDVLTFAWFSTNYPPLPASDLVDSNGLTDLGTRWRYWMAK
jgi:hypothetical protein